MGSKESPLLWNVNHSGPWHSDHTVFKKKTSLYGRGSAQLRIQTLLVRQKKDGVEVGRSGMPHAWGEM